MSRRVRDAASLASILLVGLVAYLPSFSGAFVLDDHEHIVENPRIRQLWPPGPWLAGTARPLVDGTLALNYAAHGLDARGYHAFNLAIHLLTALFLFAVVRRTLAGRRLAHRYGVFSRGLALAAAMVWVAHPLTTQAVTYVIQRGESMASLFYLITLYAVIRGEASARHARAWHAGAVACCALGMGAKPVMVTAPLAILLYDRIFLAGSWRDLVARRFALHAGLAATWSVAGYLAATAPNPTAGFGIPISPLEYALSQPGVVLHYLRLASWPSPLVFDYGWPIARELRAILLPLVPVVGLLVATGWALARRRPIGFLGAWFFLTLAPTSSVVPIKDLAFEHRTYLALAAVVVLFVVVAFGAVERAFPRPTAARRVAVAGVAVVVVALATATWLRNQVYRSEIALWTDVLEKRPENPRAYYALGASLVMAGQHERAIPLLREALRRQPENPHALNNLGVALLNRGMPEQALARFDEALAANPRWARAHHNRGVVLAQLGRHGEAIQSYREARRLLPDDPRLRSERAIAESLEHIRQAATGHLEALYRASALLRSELQEQPQAGASDLAIDKVYRRVVDGEVVGHLRVLVDFSQPEVRAQLETQGRIPTGVVDAMSEAVTIAMRLSGAEAVEPAADRKTSDRAP